MSETTQETAPTPRPWKARDWIIEGPDGEEIADCDRFNTPFAVDLANADHIVKCVNAHPDLVAALKAAREVVVVAERMSGGRGAYDWIWVVHAQIDDALKAGA